jgi:hypothetical protein
MRTPACPAAAISVWRAGALIKFEGGVDHPDAASDEKNQQTRRRRADSQKRAGPNLVDFKRKSAAPAKMHAVVRVPGSVPQDCHTT